MENLHIALTADLHWGQNRLGDEATLALQQFLLQKPPDVLILAGDQGSADHFAECLELFRDLECPKALVPGNHDVWVDSDDKRGDSLMVYREYLPLLCERHAFHYLDRGPLQVKAGELALVGSINWYDYSWSLARMRQEVPDWEARLRTKTFSRGRHNDARFVRWSHDDVSFSRDVVAALEQHLHAALAQAEQAIVVTHHPAFYGLGFPRDRPPSGLDGLLWDALSGNATLEDLLTRHGERIPFVFSGHTHRARENTLGTIRGYNIGGDYHFKRLLLLDWPVGTVTAHVFGNQDVRR